MVDTEARSRPAKVGHRKSRNGCVKCKARRVKCDEQRPTCGSCNRLQMDCTWPSRNHGPASQHTTRSTRPTPSPNPPPSRPSPSTISGSTSTTYPSPFQATEGPAAFMTNWPRWPSEEDNPFTTTQPDDDTTHHDTTLPESKSRRLMEHRLMHYWHLNFATLIFPRINPSTSERSLWITHVPHLGQTHDNVLYGMLAASATKLLRTTSGAADATIHAARQDYFIAALHAQRREVAHLCAANAEPVCFGALLICLTAFAMLKERRYAAAYTPPLEWLRLGRGAGAVLWQSVEAIVAEGREAEHPALMAVATSYPYFGRDQSYFDAGMRVRFSGVLTRAVGGSGDDWSDVEMREAYEKALSYVGSIQGGIDDGEPVYVVARRIQTFSLLVPPRFIGLLGEGRPRALVVLAHFWATVSQCRGVWWLGEADEVDGESTALREVRAIRAVLPREWLKMMVWPLDQVGLRDEEMEQFD